MKYCLFHSTSTSLAIMTKKTPIEILNCSFVELWPKYSMWKYSALNPIGWYLTLQPLLTFLASENAVFMLLVVCKPVCIFSMCWFPFQTTDDEKLNEQQFISQAQYFVATCNLLPLLVTFIDARYSSWRRRERKPDTERRCWLSKKLMQLNWSS